MLALAILNQIDFHVGLEVQRRQLLLVLRCDLIVQHILVLVEREAHLLVKCEEGVVPFLALVKVSFA